MIDFFAERVADAECSAGWLDAMKGIEPQSDTHWYLLGYNSVATNGGPV